MMFHSCSLSCGQEIAAGSFKESQNGLVFPRGCVCDINHDLSARDALANPSPVRVLTPEEGAAATTSWPCCCRFVTSLDPISPVPPITTIFILFIRVLV